MAMIAEAAKSSFELTRSIMWLPMTVVLLPPTLVITWYFWNEWRIRRKRNEENTGN